jgi:hypothetical protein
MPAVQPRPASLDRALEYIDAAAAQIFKDPSVRSVGIQRVTDGFAYRAVRNSEVILPQAFKALPHHFEDVPVFFTDTPGELDPLLKVPHSGPGSPLAATTVPEVRPQRPLVCGSQIQNFDDDQRQGVFDQGYIIIGTLGCFVRLADGKPAVLSNNHVLAGENRGQKGSDRITQPGAATIQKPDEIALLTDFQPIQPSPDGARPALGNVNFNELDSAVAILHDEIAFAQSYLAFRGLPPPSGTAVPSDGDKVFKVGRTTGLTRGQVTDIATVVGPVPYDPGSCWFRRSITIEGENGVQFSDRGDSGSAILLESTGQVIGLLYAGNGRQTYTCPIDSIIQRFNCTIW